MTTSPRAGILLYAMPDEDVLQAPNIERPIHKRTLQSVELARQRAAVIVPMLHKAGKADVPLTAIAHRLGVTLPVLRSWLSNATAWLREFCPWRFGDDRSHLRLAENTQQFDAPNFLDHLREIRY